MIPEQEALLRTIIENPEDDVPRLVFADWLQEHGDDARAEFIRLQCERSCLPVGDEWGDALWDRIHELQAANERSWIAELGLPPGQKIGCTFSRGFVSRVSCTARYFVRNAKAILDAAPVELVGLRRPSARNLREVIEHTEFRQVRGVEFMMSDRGAEHVAGFFDRLRGRHIETVSLNVSAVHMGSRPWRQRNAVTVESLAACPGLAGASRLWLAFLLMGDAGALALADSPNLGNVRVLNVAENPLSRHAEDALRLRFGDRVCLGLIEVSNFTWGDLGLD